jgi:hypothetical protein
LWSNRSLYLGLLSHDETLQVKNQGIGSAEMERQTGPRVSSMKRT